MRSQNAKCEKRRKIVVTKGGGGPALAQGVSDSDGDFSFSGSTPPAGIVEAEVKQKRIRPKTRAHKHVCLRARIHVAVH